MSNIQYVGPWTESEKEIFLNFEKSLPDKYQTLAGKWILKKINNNYFSADREFWEYGTLASTNPEGLLYAVSEFSK